MTPSEIKAVLDHARETVRKLELLGDAMHEWRDVALRAAKKAGAMRDGAAEEQAISAYVTASEMVEAVVDAIPPLEWIAQCAEERGIGQRANVKPDTKPN